MVNAEDLLVRGKRTIDPFNRLGCTIDPIITVIEFCQIIGPRPLKTIPEMACEKAHLDMDAIAVWLMSSETASGTVLLIYNQQMGIYALSYHTVIYDVRARAFQRPLCVSYLSSERPTGELVSKFTASARQLLTPLIVCNRRLFVHQLSLMIQLSDAIESDTVQQYYALYTEDMMTMSCSKKIQAVAEQARKLRPRMQNLYESLSVSALADSECCGHSNRLDTQSEAENTLNQFRQAAPLRPMEELAPCTYPTFISSLTPLLLSLSHQPSPSGVLYSAGVTVLKFPKYETPVKERSPDAAEKEVIRNEESLKTITGFLDQVLYPVVAGDPLLVCGSEQRRNTVMDLVHKLNKVIPKSHANRNQVLWNTDAQKEHDGVFGECVPRGSKREIKGGAVLDANTNVLRCIPYAGKLLAHLSIRRKFPSDASLLLYISASLTWLCSLVYLCRFVSMQSLPKEDNLSSDDYRILANLLNEVDFVKFNTIKSGLDKKRNLASAVKTFHL